MNKGKFIINIGKIKQLLIALRTVFLGGTIALFAAYIVNTLDILFIAFLIFLILTIISVLLFIIERKKNPWWEEYSKKCPKCNSMDIEGLNLYKGMFIKKSLNQRQYQCKKCKHKFWDSESFL